MLRHIKQCLFLKVERAVHDQGPRRTQSESLLCEVEAPSDRERSGRQYDGADALEQALVENWRHIDGRRLQVRSTATPLDPVHESRPRILYEKPEPLNVILRPAKQRNEFL